MMGDKFKAEALAAEAEARLESMVALRLMALRGSVFTRTKMSFWKEVMADTTTLTQPPADEFDHPESISERGLNRVRAQPSRLKALPWNEVRHAPALLWVV